MNNDEAKFVLSAYRPAGDDAGDARFADAIVQAERDPDLAAWFRESRRFDGAMSEALSAVPVPADLRANILAGGKISRPRWAPTRRTVFALAASVLLIATLAGMLLNRAPHLDRWQRDALAFIPKLGSAAAGFDMENKDAVVLQQWLETQNAPAPAAFPLALRTMPSLGCKTISAGGQPVSIICFKMQTGELVHLVVSAHEDSSLSGKPRFIEEDGWRTASWNAEGHAYTLATKASERELREIMLGAEATAQRRKSERIFAVSANWH